MLKIGHRGAPAHAPENTLASFRYALHHGMDGLEMDIWLCKSGEPVVIHDDSLKRTTGNGGYVQDMTLQELQQLDAGNGERIPTLREVLLETMGINATLFLEIKSLPAASHVAEIIGAYVASGQFNYEHIVVISFLKDALLEVHQHDPKIQLGVNFDDTANKGDGQFYYRSYTGIADIIEQASFDDKPPFSINPRADLCTDAMIALAHTKGVKVFTWGIDDKHDIARLHAMHADGVMVDDPAWVLEDSTPSW